MDWINEIGDIVKYEKGSLSNSLTNILENDELRSKLSSKCVNLVQNEFNLENIIDKLEKIYKTEAHSNSLG